MIDDFDAQAEQEGMSLKRMKEISVRIPKRRKSNFKMVTTKVLNNCFEETYGTCKYVSNKALIPNE